MPASASPYITADSNVVLLDATLIYRITDPRAYILSEAHVAPALDRLFRAAATQVTARWTLNDDKHPLLSVQLRDDGLIETTRDDGWNVLDPADVLAVEWVSRDTEGQGQYL